MVHIKKAERNKLLFSLLMDGVLTVKKEFHGPHPDTQVDNLKVWMLMRSLHSKGYIDVVFSWRHYYYTLNNNGIAYIKAKLGITEPKVQPRTRTVRAEAIEAERTEGQEGEERRGGRGRGLGLRGRRGDRGNRGDRFGRGERRGDAPAQNEAPAQVAVE